MKQFKTTFYDSKGDPNELTWMLNLTWGTMKAVKAMVGIDLTAGEDIMKIAEDAESLVNVVYALVKSQADAHGMTDVQFGEHLTPAVVEDELLPLLHEEIADFFPKGRRELLKKMTTAMTKKMNLIHEKVGEMATLKMETEMDKIDLDQAVSALTLKSTDSPAQSGSTPTP